MIFLRRILLGPARQWLRVLVALFVSVVLPYSSTRCLADAATNCPITDAAQRTSRSVAHQAMRADVHVGHQHHGEQHDSATTPHSEHRTCCDLTGKDRLAHDSTPPSTAPVSIVVATVYDRESWHRVADLDRRADLVASAHAPPRYLRFATLLI